jgi:hypothetical protein
MINELFEQMILQVQGFFNYMNAQCNVLNIGQTVLQVMTVLSFVSSFDKGPQGSEISAKVIVKNCKLVTSLQYQ